MMNKGSLVFLVVVAAMAVVRVAAEADALDVVPDIEQRIPEVRLMLDLSPESGNLFNQREATNALRSVAVDPATNTVVVLPSTYNTLTVYTYTRTGEEETALVPPREKLLRNSWADLASGDNRPSKAVRFNAEGTGYMLGRSQDQGSAPLPDLWNVMAFSLDPNTQDPANVVALTSPGHPISNIEMIGTHDADLYYVDSEVFEVEEGVPTTYTKRIYKYGSDSPLARFVTKGHTTNICSNGETALVITRFGDVHVADLSKGASEQEARELKDKARSCVALPNGNYYISTAEGILERDSIGDRVDFYRFPVEAWDMTFRSFPATVDQDSPPGELFVFRRNTRDVVRVQYNVTDDNFSQLGLFIGLGGAAVFLCVMGTGYALYGNKKDGDESKKEYNPSYDDSGFDD